MAGAEIHLVFHLRRIDPGGNIRNFGDLYQGLLDSVLDLSCTVHSLEFHTKQYTFKSAANVPVAMAKVFGFYLVFTPLSTWLGNLAEGRGVNDFLILAVTMLSNFVLEFLFCKFVVYRGKENTI